jgi:hypothetical protein
MAPTANSRPESALRTFDRHALDAVHFNRQGGRVFCAFAVWLAVYLLH